MAADRRSRASRTPAAVTGHGQDVEFGDLELPLSLGQQNLGSSEPGLGRTSSGW